MPKRFRASSTDETGRLRTIIDAGVSFPLAHAEDGLIYDIDLIVVLKDGVVVEQGTHETLLAVHGVYHELWRAQQDEHHE